MQCHPEYPIEFIELLIQIRKERLGPDAYDQGLASLELPLDSTAVGHWLTGFLVRR